MKSSLAVAVASGVLTAIAGPAHAQIAEPTAAEAKRAECTRMQEILEGYSRRAAELEGEGWVLTQRNEGFRAQLKAAEDLPGDTLAAHLAEARRALPIFQQRLAEGSQSDPTQTALMQETIVRLQQWIYLLSERHTLWETSLPFDPEYNVTARDIVRNELRLGEIVNELGTARSVTASYYDLTARCYQDLAVLEASESNRVTPIEQVNAASSIDGVYDSYEGMLTFRTIGGQIRGDYLNSGAHVMITGYLTGNVLEGTWTTANSGAQCDHGKIRFVFSADGFTGSSGFCNDEPHLPWSGTRRAASQ